MDSCARFFAILMCMLYITGIYCHNMDSLQLEEKEAKSYLRYKRSNLCDSNEAWCEENKYYCMHNSEYKREEMCQTHKCPVGKTCYLSTPCFAHWEVGCSDNPCYGIPCFNGGTCQFPGDSYYCQCPPDYDKKTDCEEDCIPGPADILFVVDASKSTESTLNQSRKYIYNFVSNLKIGTSDFQVAVMTYAYSSSLLIAFDTYSTNDTLLEAISTMMIQRAEVRVSNTGIALGAASEIISNQTLGARVNSIFKFVIVLTDGLSSDPILAAVNGKLLQKQARVLVVAIGSSVCHTTACQLSSSSSLVSTINDNYALSTVFLETLHHKCDVCSLSTEVDVLMLFDSASNCGQNSKRRILVRELAKALDIENTNHSVAMTTFTDSTITDMFIYGSHTKTDELVVATQEVILKKDCKKANTTHVLQYVARSSFSANKNARNSSKKAVVIFPSIDADWGDTVSIKNEVDDLVRSNISVYVVTFANVDSQQLYEHVSEVISDPFFHFYVEDEYSTNVFRILSSSLRSLSCLSNPFD